MKEITQEELAEELPKLKGKNILVIFSADSCKWCQRLKSHLADGALLKFCEENSIVLFQVKLPPKKDEICTEGACKITARTKYDIKAIPTAVLIDDTGSVVAQTGYLDNVDAEGSIAYSKWIDSNLLF